MLRIATEPHNGGVVLRVEGSLRGPWVNELESTWQRNRHYPQVRVHLADVSYVDDAGKSLLARMVEHGAALTASGPYMQAIVEGITRIEAARSAK